MSSIVIKAGSPESQKLIGMLTAACQDVCGTAPNFVEVTLVDDISHETWVCTIQRPNGETPAEKLKAAESRIEAVRKVIEAAGCECLCEHHKDEHDPGCNRCVPCHVEAALR